jgi:secreted PhoX family phosphatase
MHEASKFKQCVLSVNGGFKNEMQHGLEIGQTMECPAATNREFEPGRIFPSFIFSFMHLSQRALTTSNIISPRRQKWAKAIPNNTSPHGAEATGPCFTPDGTTLFVSVQHTLEDAETLDKVETRWPDFKGNNIPRPAVVAIQRTDGKEVGA